MIRRILMIALLGIVAAGSIACVPPTDPAPPFPSERRD
jgi:hypothetical protein